MAAPSSAGFRLNVWLLAFNPEECAWTMFYQLEDSVILRFVRLTLKCKHWIQCWRSLSAQVLLRNLRNPGNAGQMVVIHQICGKGFALFQCQQMSLDMLRGPYHLCLLNNSTCCCSWRNLKIDIWHMNERSMKNQTLSLHCHSCHCHESGLPRFPLPPTHWQANAWMRPGFWIPRSKAKRCGFVEFVCRSVCRSLWDLQVRQGGTWQCIFGCFHRHICRRYFHIP